MLRARTVPAGTTIIRKGERGDAMYLIASGRVEVESANDKVVLEEGDFFGEIALLSREPRSATVTALRPTDLLVLDADDFLRLVDRLPDIGAKVQAVAKERKIGSAASPADGDRGQRWHTPTRCFDRSRRTTGDAASICSRALTARSASRNTAGTSRTAGAGSRSASTRPPAFETADDALREALCKIAWLRAAIERD